MPRIAIRRNKVWTAPIGVVAARSGIPAIFQETIELCCRASRKPSCSGSQGEWTTSAKKTQKTQTAALVSHRDLPPIANELTDPVVRGAMPTTATQEAPTAFKMALLRLALKNGLGAGPELLPESE